MDDNENRIKVVFLGESDVGKSALINRYISNSFDEFAPHYANANYVTKKIKYNNKDYHFDIWDTCGYEKYRALTKIFIKNAKIIVVVYDTTRKRTFLELDFWLDLILKELGPDIFLILVGNKIDLYENEEITENDGKKFGEALRAKFILSSAKYGDSKWSDSFEDALIDYIKTLNK